LPDVTTIIFDLDGTLVDSSLDILNSVNLALREMDLPVVTLEQAKKGIGPGSEVFTRTMLPSDQLHRWEELLQIYRRFYMVIGPEDVTRLKPDPEMIQTIMRITGSPPEATLIIGDTDNDLQAGKNAHITTCAATYGYFPRARLEAQNPDFLIDTPMELMAVLDGRLKR